MISATLKGYQMYRNDDIECLIKMFVLKFGFEKKRLFFNRKSFHRDFWEGITTFLSTSIVLNGSVYKLKGKHGFVL